MLGGLPGVTPAALAEARAQLAAAAPAQAEPACEVWAENWDSFLFFCSLGNHWAKLHLVRTVTGPMGASATHTEVRRDCLPPERVEASARLQGIARSRWPQLFADLRLMEAAVLAKDRETAAAER